MRLFGFGKKKEILDLTEKYKKQQEKIQSDKEEADSQSSSGGAFSFLSNLASSSSPEAKSEDYLDISGAEEKRKKLAKRLIDMTAKLEDLSNQIYHLQQRIEVLERKMGVGSY